MDIRAIGSEVQANAATSEKNFAVEMRSTAPPASAPVEANTSITQPDPATNAAQVTQAVKSLNKTMQGLSQSIEFSIDEDSNRTIVKVVDQTTRILIRQIPTGEVLEIAKALDRVQGLLISQKV